jgi:hypothetical protein
LAGVMCRSAAGASRWWWHDVVVMSSYCPWWCARPGILLDTLWFGFDVVVGRLPVVAGLLELVVIVVVGLFRVKVLH